MLFRSFIVNLISSFSILFILAACEKGEKNQVTGEEQPYPEITDMTELIANPGFDWKLAGEIEFTVQTLDNQDNPIAGAKLDVYNYLNDNETLLFSGITDIEGTLKAYHPLPQQSEEVIIRTSFLGLSLLVFLKTSFIFPLFIILSSLL